MIPATLSIPVGQNEAMADYTLSSAAKGLFISLKINGLPLSDIAVIGNTTSIAYHLYNVGVPTEVGGSAIFFVPVDVGQDPSVHVTFTIEATVANAGDAVAHISETLDAAAVAVMGLRGAPPVYVAIPPTATDASGQSNGTTFTLVAAVPGKRIRLWSGWVTGRASAPTTGMVAEIRQIGGHFLLVAEGFGAASAQHSWGGLELGDGVGVECAGAPLTSLVGGVVYDYAN